MELLNLKKKKTKQKKTRIESMIQKSTINLIER